MLFENLDRAHQEEVETRAGSRAILIAKHRVERQFGEYLRKARSEKERTARIQLIEDDLDKLIVVAAKEFGSPEDPVRSALNEYVSTFKLACGSCGCDDCGEADSKCSCADCSTCKGKKESRLGQQVDLALSADFETIRKHFAGAEDAKCPHCGSLDIGTQTEMNGHHMLTCNTCGKRSRFDKAEEAVEKMSRWHVLSEKKLPGWNDHQKSDRGAVFGEDGGSYEMPDIKTIDSKDGWGDQGAVKTDHKRVPEEGLKPIDIKSVEHPHENQSVEERWNREYTGEYTDSGDPNTSKKPHEYIDADNPIGDTEAIPTKTFQGDSWSTNPVTQKVPGVTSRWHIIPD